MKRIHSLLGFAQRAGKLISGEQGVESGLRRGQIRFLIIAEDSSNNTKSKFKDMCKHNGVKCAIYGLKDEMGMVIGKPRRAVIGITDRNFATSIALELVNCQDAGEKN